MATSTVHRAPSPAEDSRLEDLRLEKDFSLQGRLAAALAPEATDSERDALLYAISRPLAPEASPREHADFLLSLLSDERSLGLTGSNGRTLKRAATRALLALGYPYALELPPEVVELSASERSRGRRVWWGKALITANAVGPAIALFLAVLRFDLSNEVELIAAFLAALGASTVLPMGLILWGRKKASLLLRIFGSLGHIASGLAVGWVGLLLLEELMRSPNLIEGLLTTAGLSFALVQLGGTYLLQAPPEEEK